MATHISNINDLLKKNHFPEVEKINELPSSGSSRIYFRVFFKESTPKTIIASYNPDVNENIAHYSFSLHFKNKGFRVPDIYAKDDKYIYFLLQDLGDRNLLDELNKLDHSTSLMMYKRVINHLLKFQIEGIKGLDLDVAYPVKEFSRDSILWDLNYFKYYFLKAHDIFFDELLLENDFQHFTDHLLKASSDFFLYRDFQTRNIMIKDADPWFIDFQGGRKGPLQYDIVSLLYQAKANLSNEIREELLYYYLQKLNSDYEDVSTSDFMKYYSAFIYFRTMQVMGAYGFRGKLQRKGHFLQSIPYAIQNLEYLLNNKPLSIELPELNKVLNQISKLKEYDIPSDNSKKLVIEVNSFSFKKGGVPIDTSGNGGGFVFDCRSLPNPGRYDELKDFTGLDMEVKKFLKEKTEMNKFLDNCQSMVTDSVDNYLHRKFSNLQVNFGCTGGKHRSVFSAECLANKLEDKYDDKVIIIRKHIQLEKGI